MKSNEDEQDNRYHFFFSMADGKEGTTEFQVNFIQGKTVTKQLTARNFFRSFPVAISRNMLRAPLISILRADAISRIGSSGS